jgi:hypothetical protein
MPGIIGGRPSGTLPGRQRKKLPQLRNIGKTLGYTSVFAANAALQGAVRAAKGKAVKNFLGLDCNRDQT